MNTIISVDEALEILGDEYKDYSKKEIEELIRNYTILISKIIDSLYLKYLKDGKNKIT